MCQPALSASLVVSLEAQYIHLVVTASGRRRLLLGWVPLGFPRCPRAVVTHSGLDVVMHSGLLVDSHGEAALAKECAQLVFGDPSRTGRRYRLVRLCSTVSLTGKCGTSWWKRLVRWFAKVSRLTGLSHATSSLPSYYSPNLLYDMLVCFQRMLLRLQSFCGNATGGSTGQNTNTRGCPVEKPKVRLLWCAIV
jgi:hypothetical protein